MDVLADMIFGMSDLAGAREGTSINVPDLLAIIAIVVAVIAVIASIWAVRRWGNRRPRVLLTYESTSLIADVPFAANADLKVTFKDSPVENPHVLQLRFQNIGPMDLTSGRFDGGRPIIIKTNSKLYGLVDASHPHFTQISALGESGVIKIPPLLLKRKDQWEAAVIVSGEPDIETDVPLADVDVLDRKTFDAELAKSLASYILRTVGLLSPNVGISVVELAEIVTSDRGRKR